MKKIYCLIIVGLFAVSCSSMDKEEDSQGKLTIPVTISGGDKANKSFKTKDGWEVTFDHVYVHVRAFKLQGDPDLYDVNGATIWKDLSVLPGPYLIDLSKKGGVTGKKGGLAQHIVTFENLNKMNNEPLKEKIKYGFSFGFEEAGKRPVEYFFTENNTENHLKLMQDNNWAVLYIGSARRVNPCENNSVNTVYFQLGFSEFQHNVNCENPELFENENELSHRGVYASDDPNKYSEATFLVQNIFVANEEKPEDLYFDIFAEAASLRKKGTVDQPLTSDDLKSISGKPLSIDNQIVNSKNCHGIDIEIPQLESESFFDHVSHEQATSGRMNGAGTCGSHLESSHPTNPSP